MWFWFALLSLNDMFLLPFFLPFFHSALLRGFHLAFCGLETPKKIIFLLTFTTCALADFCVQFKTLLLTWFSAKTWGENRKWKLINNSFIVRKLDTNCTNVKFTCSWLACWISPRKNTKRAFHEERNSTYDSSMKELSFDTKTNLREKNEKKSSNFY